METPWFDWLRKNKGQLEWTGKMPSDFVKMVFLHTTFGDPGNSTPPCCAATLCAALELNGYESTHRADAISFKDYGTSSDLRTGAICVFQWDDGSHHVSVYDRPYNNERAFFIGGNQGHLLQTALLPLNKIIATRWPIRRTTSPQLISTDDKSVT